MKLRYTIPIMLILSSLPVFAEDTTEGRISEHSIVSLVALTGLLVVAHFARNSRKREFDMKD